MGNDGFNIDVPSFLEWRQTHTATSWEYNPVRWDGLRTATITLDDSTYIFSPAHSDWITAATSVIVFEDNLEACTPEELDGFLGLEIKK